MIIYCVILMLLLIFFITTFHYKKEEYSSLPKKEHPLYFLYGSCLFIITLYDKLISKGKTSNRDLQKAEKLSKLYIGINPQKLLLLHKAKVISFSLSVLFTILVIGVIFSLSNTKDTASISSIQRPTDNSSSSHELTVDYEGETTNVVIEIESQAISLYDALLYFDEHRSAIEKSLIGENPDFLEISKSLYFPSSLDNIQISWRPLDTKYVDYSGNIIYENIPSTGVQTNINAELSYGGHKASITIPIFILPDSNSESLLDKINSGIAANNDVFSSSVELPSQIEGKEIKYYASYEIPKINFF